MNIENSSPIAKTQLTKQQINAQRTARVLRVNKDTRDYSTQESRDRTKAIEGRANFNGRTR